MSSCLQQLHDAFCCGCGVSMRRTAHGVCCITGPQQQRGEGARQYPFQPARPAPPPLLQAWACLPSQHRLAPPPPSPLYSLLLPLSSSLPPHPHASRNHHYRHLCTATPPPRRGTPPQSPQGVSCQNKKQGMMSCMLLHNHASRNAAIKITHASTWDLIILSAASKPEATWSTLKTPYIQPKAGKSGSKLNTT